MKWSPQQSRALDSVASWLRDRSAPWFYLAGYAGTGKTTLAKHFAEGFDGHVAYGSFTGKAASVMRSKGCTDATTVHRLVYASSPRSTARLKELQEKLAECVKAHGDDDTRTRALRIQVSEEVRRARQPNFTPKRQSEVEHIKLFVLDECSMISGQMADDILAFGIPVLVLGDPAQLPPVAGEGFFTRGKPDVMLTEVHRQAQESGILRLATDVREGRALDYCDMGDARVMARGELDPNDVPGYDQVLVGKNVTRHATNARMRDLLGRTELFPEPGDKLVCLRNCHDLGLLNGEIYQCGGSEEIDSATLNLSVIPDGGAAMSVQAWKAPLLGQRLDHWDHNRETQEFGYGYVLTVHKAQGSGWPSVIVFDESRVFRADARKWMYTAITRASERLTVVR